MPIEDFTTYTEVDTSNRLTVTASRALAVDVDVDIDVYLYKDRGVDHFDALNVGFEGYTNSNSTDQGEGGMGFANAVGDVTGWETDSLFCRLQDFSGAHISLARGNFVALDDVYLTLNTLYYFLLERAAGNDTVTLKIYSDSDKTNLLDTLSVAGFGTAKWRHSYGFVNRNWGGSGKDFDGYIQNLDLNPIDLDRILRIRLDGTTYGIQLVEL